MFVWGNIFGKFLLVYSRYFLASFLSLENDKNDFEKAIKHVKPSILLFKCIFILFISSFDKFPTLYNSISSDKVNDLNLTPSYMF